MAVLMLPSTVFGAAASSYPTKATPVGADKVLISDSADAWKVKNAPFSAFVGLTSLPTATNQIIQATGAGTYEWTSSVAGLIDDTAGNGDVDKLLSADRVVDLIAAGGASFAFDTFPTYEDSPHVSGIARNGTTGAIYSDTAGKWLTFALTDSLDPASVGVSDDFSSDTSANYTAIGGGISVSGGNAGGSGTWAKNLVYHESTLGTANQEVSASVTYNGATDSAGVLARVSTGTPKTGYIAYFGETGKVLLSSFSGTTVTPIDTYIGSYASGTYTIKLSVSGTTIKVYVGGVERISVTDSTYSAGDYIGLIFDRDNTDYDARADDLLGVAL